MELEQQKENANVIEIKHLSIEKPEQLRLNSDTFFKKNMWRENQVRLNLLKTEEKEYRRLA